MTRVYRAATIADLGALLATGELPADPDVVVAEGDDEASEYDALMTAADASAALLTGPGRRVVVVAEVGDPEAAVPLRHVVAVHADTADRPIDADPDDDLAWYGTQEIESLIR